MLKRILTALVLIPIFVLLLFFLSPMAFFVLTGIIIVYAAWEWALLMGVKKIKYRLIYPAIIFLLLIYSVNHFYMPGVLAVTFAWWLLALLLICFYPRLSSIWGKSIIIRGFMGVMVLIPSWMAINFIRNIYDIGIYVLLFLFVLIWGADSGAYFVGKWCGKTKLAPHVSPGKTWQGLWGAFVVGLVITITVLYFIKVPYKNWLPACVIATITVLFSVVGDLFESMLKRNEGLKDSGQLLPGHGGILDRIDSLTAAAPVFLFADLMQRILF